MLSDDLARYVALHEALGFSFRTQRILLRIFVAYAERHGDELIKSDRVIEWAIEAPSPEQRRNRLLTVRRFAIAMHAENNAQRGACRRRPRPRAFPTNCAIHLFSR